MNRRAYRTCALVLLLLLAGCVAGIGGSGDGADGPECHGLLVADDPVQEPDETVAVSNATVQSTEPIATVIDRYRENGTRQRMGVDGDRANATSRALGDLRTGDMYGIVVSLNDDTTVSLHLATNGSLCTPVT